jgi:hypothetical protein
MAPNATLKREIPKRVPIEANEANYPAGADEYLTDTFSHLFLGHIQRDRVSFS